jgi:type I restriction enzyme S subunit
MSSEWQTRELGQLTTFKYGKFLAKSDLDSSGFAVFSGYGVVGYLPTYQFEEQQLLIVCRGEGGTGDVKMSPPKCSITNLSIVLSHDEKVVSKKFLYWALKGSDTHRLRTGSAQAQIVIGSLEKFELMIPREKAVQESIAAILDTLDDRITLLRETNATLEAIAQALFKSWFVDFDPVRAKMEGRTPEGMDEATAALFPDGLEESALGLVPRGWRVAKLGADCGYLSRGVSPKYIDIGGTLVLNQKCIRDFSVDYGKGRRHDQDQRKIDGRLVAVGDVLVNSTGVGTLGRVAQVLQLPEAAIVDSHVTVVRAGANISWPYLGQWMMRKQPEIEAMGEGSTGQTELSRAKLADLDLLVPKPPLLDEFDRLVISLKERVAVNENSAQTLATLRDTLLPRLISGQLRLPMSV